MITKCFQCNSELKIIKNRPYLYTECGLPDVTLIGITQYQCEDCGESYVDIPMIEQLHLVIGKLVSCKKERLTGDEIRFLRKELHMKAKDFADMISITAEHMSRLERGEKNISSTLDKLIRSIYMMYASEDNNTVLHHNVLSIFAKIGGKKTAPISQRIELNPPDWMSNEPPSFCFA